MSVKLSADNFFKHYIIHPRSNNLSKKDKNKALIFSIALAVLFGIPHAVAKIRERRLRKKNPEENSDHLIVKISARNIGRKASGKSHPEQSSSQQPKRSPVSQHLNIKAELESIPAHEPHDKAKRKEIEEQSRLPDLTDQEQEKSPDFQDITVQEVPDKPALQDKAEQEETIKSSLASEKLDNILAKEMSEKSQVIEDLNIQAEIEEQHCLPDLTEQEESDHSQNLTKQEPEESHDSQDLIAEEVPEPILQDKAKQITKNLIWLEEFERSIQKDIIEKSQITEDLNKSEEDGEQHCLPDLSEQDCEESNHSKNITSPAPAEAQLSEGSNTQEEFVKLTVSQYVPPQELGEQQVIENLNIPEELEAPQISEDSNNPEEFEKQPSDDIIKQRWKNQSHNEPKDKAKQEEFEEPSVLQDVASQEFEVSQVSAYSRISKWFEELPVSPDVTPQQLGEPQIIEDSNIQEEFEAPLVSQDTLPQEQESQIVEDLDTSEEFEESQVIEDSNKSEEFEELPVSPDVTPQQLGGLQVIEDSNKQEEFEKAPVFQNVTKQVKNRKLPQKLSKKDIIEPQERLHGIVQGELSKSVVANGLPKLHDRWLTRSSNHEIFLKTEISTSDLLSASELYNEKRLPLRSSKDLTKVLKVVTPVQEHLAETQEIIQSNFSEITSLHSSGSLHSSLNLSGEWEEIGTTFKERFDNACELIKDKLKLSTEFQCLSFFGGNFTRNVTKTLDKDEKPLLFIKMANGRFAKEHERIMKRDAFAYLIDNLFNFGVVPPTIFMMENTIPAVEEKIFHPVFPAIVQVAVPVEEQAIPLDVTHIQNAILFNLLTGREDGRRDNSVISKGQKVFEVDNEQIGNQRTDSWLAKEYASVVLQEDLIKNVIEKPEEFITDSFVLFEKSYQILDDDFKENILHNFRNIVNFFKNRGLANVQVGELVFAINSLAE